MKKNQGRDSRRISQKNSGDQRSFELKFEGNNNEGGILSEYLENIPPVGGRIEEKGGVTVKPLKAEMLALFQAICCVFTELFMPVWQKDVRQITHQLIEAMVEAKKAETGRE